MKHLVQFSTGLSSAEVAWRLVTEYGRENVVLLTADTKKEDPDNWRFGREVWDALKCEWIKLTDGRTPMEVGRDHKCVPNNRMAVCSRVLKRELLRRHLDANYDPSADVAYIGYDWSEPHRIASSQRFWEPWTVRAPLAEPPYALSLQAVFRNRGIEPPDLYKYGYAHANCGGCCVRAGQAAWAITLQVHPDRYLEWEAEEEETRELLGKDVAILRDRTGGTVTPLTLRTFRERKEAAATLFDVPGTAKPDWYDKDDFGACGCDMDSDTEPVQLHAQAPKVERWDGSGWIPLAATVKAGAA